MMNLGVSSLAVGDISDDLLTILNKNSIKYIELVIPQFTNWDGDLYSIGTIVNKIKSHGIHIKSTQAILYNSNVQNIHSGEFINHMKIVSDVCRSFNINKMVLGAPAARKICTIDQLATIFEEVNNILLINNQQLMIEPNQKGYGGAYFYQLSEIVAFLKDKGYSNIMSMIDTHNSVLEQQDPSLEYNTFNSYVGHVHISEVDLAGFKDTMLHRKFAQTIKSSNYKGLVIYEVKNSTNLDKELQLFKEIYG